LAVFLVQAVPRKTPFELGSACLACLSALLAVYEAGFAWGLAVAIGDGAARGPIAGGGAGFVAVVAL